MTDTVMCYVHGMPFPRSACHEHHEMPRAAGGGDEATNLTFVCATCHNMIHRCAEAILGSRMGMANDLALQYSPNALPMRERLLRLAGYAADMLKVADMGAIFLLNSPYPKEEVWNHLPKTVQQQIIQKKQHIPVSFRLNLLRGVF